MKIIRPTVMQPSMLVSTDATESLPDWSSATTYALGAQVVFNRSIYESLQGSNTNRNPETQPTWWLLLGPSNQWAMFDDQISTQTVRDESLTVVIATGFIDALYLGNILGNSVTLTVRDGLGGPIVFEETQGLQGELVGDWYQYFFFDPLVRRTQALFQAIPPFADSHATIEIETGPGEQVAIGSVSFGRIQIIGTTQAGATAGIFDFSRKETDEFGVTTFVRRGFSKRLSADVLLDNIQLNRVQRLLSDIRATPVVWIGDDSPQYEEAVIVFGFYRDFSTNISYPSVSLCSLEIEGLI